VREVYKQSQLLPELAFCMLCDTTVNGTELVCYIVKARCANRYDST